MKKKSDKEKVSWGSNCLGTHVNFQDLIGGPFSQKRLPGCAADFIGAPIGEHGARALVPPRSVDSPVAIDDGSPRSTT